MSLFARNLKKCGRNVVLEDRNEAIINGQSSEVFSNPRPVRALVKTIRGKSVFDDTNTKRVATHEICLDFIEGMTSEVWVRIGSKRIKVLTVEYCCGKLKLMCTERGEDSRVANTG